MTQPSPKDMETARRWLLANAYATPVGMKSQLEAEAVERELSRLSRLLATYGTTVRTEAEAHGRAEEREACALFHDQQAAEARRRCAAARGISKGAAASWAATWDHHEFSASAIRARKDQG